MRKDSEGKRFNKEGEEELEERVPLRVTKLGKGESRGKIVGISSLIGWKLPGSLGRGTGELALNACPQDRRGLDEVPARRGKMRIFR